MFDFLRAYKYENQILIKFCGHAFALKEVFRFVKNRGFSLFGERVNDVKLPKSSPRCSRKASAEGATAGASQAPSVREAVTPLLRGLLWEEGPCPPARSLHHPAHLLTASHRGHH